LLFKFPPMFQIWIVNNYISPHLRQFPDNDLVRGCGRFLTY
jgi:hypothetical protein